MTRRSWQRPALMLALGLAAAGCGAARQGPAASMEPPAGTIVVAPTEQGWAFLDKERAGRVGASPLRLDGVSEGHHRLEVSFDAGGSTRASARVARGRTTAVTVERSAQDVIFYRYNSGVTFGEGVAALGALRGTTTGGGSVEAFMNVGIAPSFDFRMTGTLALAEVPVSIPVEGWGCEADGETEMCGFGVRHEDRSRLAVIPSLLAALRWNIGSVYSVWAGLRFGVLAAPGTEHPAVPILGPELSALSLRFGSRREWALDQSFSVSALGLANLVPNVSQSTADLLVAGSFLQSSLALRYTLGGPR